MKKYSGPERRRLDRPGLSPGRRRTVRVVLLLAAAGAVVALVAGTLAIVWVQNYAQRTDARLSRLEQDLDQRREQRDAERDDILQRIGEDRARSAAAFCTLLAGLKDPDSSELVRAVRTQYCTRPPAR